MWTCKSLSLIQTPGSRHRHASLFFILKIRGANLITRLTRAQWRSEPAEDYFIKQAKPRLGKNTSCHYWHWEMRQNKERRSAAADGESPGQLMSGREEWIFTLCCMIPMLISELRSKPAYRLRRGKGTTYLRTAGPGVAGRRTGARSEETGAAPSSGQAGNWL